MNTDEKKTENQPQQEKPAASKGAPLKNQRGNIIEASKKFIQKSSHQVEDSIRKQVKSKNFQKILTQSKAASKEAWKKTKALSNKAAEQSKVAYVKCCSDENKAKLKQVWQKSVQTIQKAWRKTEKTTKDAYHTAQEKWHEREALQNKQHVDIQAKLNQIQTDVHQMKKEMQEIKAKLINIPNRDNEKSF